MIRVSDSVKPMSNLYEAVMDALRERDDIERRMKETWAKIQSMKYEKNYMEN